MRQRSYGRQNLPFIPAEVRSWLTTFSDLQQLQVQVSEAVIIGVTREAG
jgi:hypothetical protein